MIAKMLTPHEVAKILDISYEAALTFIKFSGIDYVRIGRTYRVCEDKLQSFLSKKGHTIVELN